MHIASFVTIQVKKVNFKNTSLLNMIQWLCKVNPALAVFTEFNSTNCMMYVITSKASTSLWRVMYSSCSPFHPL